MTAAVQFAIPNSTAAAAFTGGELAVAPASGVVAAGTRHFARLFNLPAGNYTLKVWADDVATFWIGSDRVSLRRLVVHPQSSTPTTVQFFCQGGLHRVDVTLVNLASSTTCFAMALFKDGVQVYASAADKWVWAASPVVDADLPSVGDTRLSLPVWTVTPNWSDGVLERLEWLTEILPSETDIEQRRSLRRFPRRSLEASFLRAGVARQRMDSFAVGVGRGAFLVPIWFEQLKLTAALSGTTATWPNGTLAGREFFDGDVALLSGADPAIYDVVTISTVVGDTMTLAAAPGRTWPAGTRITPLRVARFDELPQFTGITDRVASVQARFTFNEPERNIVPSWGYCAPLWRFKLARSSPLEVNHSRTVYTIDVDTGVVDVTDPGGRARVAVKGDIRLFGREAMNAYRAFAAEARGRAVRFWWPSGTHDLEPVGTIGGVTLDVAQVGFAQWMTQPQDARRMLGIVFADGRPTLYRRIQSLQNMGTFDRLVLTQALPALQRDEIERVQFVVPVRFDQDAFELFHVTDNAKAVLASVVVRSSEIDGMPDIDCWVTSRPYPVFELDELAMQGTITGGRFGGLPDQVLALDVGGKITGGSFPLTVIYTPEVMDPEALDMTGRITGGSFPISVSYGAYDAGAEALSLTGTITGGALDRRLISTVMDIEAMDMGGRITGGTLQ